jgi:hypothetical protein
MDDIFLALYEPPHRARRLMRLLHFLFELFGISVNRDKSVLHPAEEVEFLGVVIRFDGSM